MDKSSSDQDGKGKGKRLSKTSPKENNSKPRVRKFRRGESKMAGRGLTNSIDESIASVLNESAGILIESDDNDHSRLPVSPKDNNSQDTSTNENEYGMDDHDDPSDDDRVPKKCPKWLADMMAVNQKCTRDDMKKEIMGQMSTVNVNITNMQTTLIKQISEYEISLSYESGRIDSLETKNTSIESTARAAGKEASLLRKKVTEDSKAINDRVSKLGIELKTHLSQLETKMSKITASSATGGPPTQNPQPVNENEQSARALTIDGVRQGDGQSLIHACQEQCFQIMGLNYSPFHIEHCYRMGHSNNPENDIKPIDDDEVKGKPRTVYVRFNMAENRNCVLRRRFNLRGHKIYVTEFFPWEVEDERRRLYGVVKKARGMKKYENKIRLEGNKIILSGVSYGVEDIDKLPDDIHPRDICTQRKGNVTFFFRCDSPLSNHHRCDIKHEGKVFNCSEQLYFYRKAEVCGDKEAMKAIKLEPNPKIQKQLGSAVQTNDDWDNKKIDIMTETTRKKFTQNPRLRDFLLGTGSTVLAEDNPNCFYWGLGFTRHHPDHQKAAQATGNHMGKILSVIRSELNESDMDHNQ